MFMIYKNFTRGMIVYIVFQIYFVLIGWTKIYAQEKRPNIIFIMSDDHAEKAISCYDSSLIKTPNIDRIAEEGIRFTNSFVTNSICAPSRATLLTGKYSNKNGLRDNRDLFDGTQQTFPKLLQNAGYQTFLIGKWHLKTDPTGFDVWKILVGQGQYYKPIFKEPDGTKEYPGYATDVITDFALETLDNRDKEKPFCLLLHHKAPHRNWMPNIKYLNEFEDKDFPLPKTFYDNYSTREETAGHADMRIENMYLSFDMKLQKDYYEKEIGTGGSTKMSKDQIVKMWDNTYNRLNDDEKKAWNNYYNKVNREYKNLVSEGKSTLEWKYQRYIKDYLKCILSIDENVGRVLDYLDKHNLTENTIVIYTSDQGFYLGEHGWYDKRFMYEESLRMPLIMRYPKEIRAGQISDSFVMNLDFAETFLDYAHVEIPADMQGQSFRKITLGEDVPNWRESIYYHYYEYPHGWHLVRQHYGIRTNRFKLIHFYGDKDIWEFYDMANDSEELRNEYNNEAYSNQVKELKEELNNLQIKYEDTNFIE